LRKRFLQEVAFIETTIGNWVLINSTHTWLVQGEKENNEHWNGEGGEGGLLGFGEGDGETATTN